MEEPSGFIEVDLFPTDVDSREHREIVNFRILLEEVAGEYDCNLIYFDVHCGTVIFSFDSDELMAKILKILKHENQGQS